jgi:hypothetical protein
MFNKKQECPVCKVTNKHLEYAYKIIDRLLVERGLPPIKDKNLKIADMIKHEESDFVPVGREIYGEQ